MNFFKQLLQRFQTKVICPRCLGKGHVSWDDIQRFNKVLVWSPDTCAYCNGKGKVNAAMTTQIRADHSYLTTSINKEERQKFIDQDWEALERAAESQKRIHCTIENIADLHFMHGYTPEQIVNHFGRHPMNGSLKIATGISLEFVHQVIEQKRLHQLLQ